MREQETRRWVDTEDYSFAMRSKEDAVDYRYFPEPDMPRLDISSFLEGRSSDLVSPQSCEGTEAENF
jgi:Asp-tRNA(Asn)/Glu-tRNA(Gln) amidotransferase B subunit